MRKTIDICIVKGKLEDGANENHDKYTKSMMMEEKYYDDGVFLKRIIRGRDVDGRMGKQKMSPMNMLNRDIWGRIWMTPYHNNVDDVIMMTKMIMTRENLFKGNRRSEG